MPLDPLRLDLRHALRAWRSQPSLYAIALAALALGIGANTTIFSVIQTVLIRPLPYQDADHLLNIFETEPKNGVQRYFVSPSDYYDWRDHSRTLEAFAGYWRNEVNLTGAGHDPYHVLDCLWPPPELTMHSPRAWTTKGKAFTNATVGPTSKRALVYN